MFDTRQPCSQNTRQPAKKTVFPFSLISFLGLLSQQVVQVKIIVIFPLRTSARSFEGIGWFDIHTGSIIFLKAGPNHLG